MQGKHHLTFVESIVTGKDGKLYFCGVFRKPLRKKQHQANNHTDNVDISNSGVSKGDSHVSEDIGMNSDMTEGKYIGNRFEIGMELDETGVNKPKETGKIFDMTTDKQTERVKRKKSGIKLGLTREEETNRINKCLPVLKTPDANAVINAAPAVSFFTGSCSPGSAGTIFFICGTSCYPSMQILCLFFYSWFLTVFFLNYRFSM